MKFRQRALACGVALGVATAGLATLPVSATETMTQLQWSDCKPEGKDDPDVVKGSQCATLQVPVDWRNPNGPTFGLAIARRTAKNPSDRATLRAAGIDRFVPVTDDSYADIRRMLAAVTDAGLLPEWWWSRWHAIAEGEPQARARA